MPVADPHPHDPREQLAREEALSLLALGEQIDTDVDALIAGCPECQRELDALRHTVHLARPRSQDAADVGAQPDPGLWSRIAGEAGIPVGLGADTRRRGRHPAGQPRSWRRWAAGIAAAVVIAAAGVTGGYLAGRSSAPQRPSITATAQLAAMPGGPTGVHGNATVRDTDTGLELSVRTANLPLRDGYYEVWLFNPDANKMVAVGTLSRSGTATVPVPPGLDVSAYHVVDVSAQKYNGNPTHQQSVLRGGLTR